MGAIVLRLGLLAGGLGFAQMGLDSFARGADVALVQFGLALLALVAGSTGFIVPLLEGGIRREAGRG